MSTSTVPRAGLGRLAAVLDGSLARPGVLDDTILLRPSALREVRIDPRRRVGRCRIGSNQ
jgi:hypothetical protein